MSNYYEWNQLSHSDKWILFPENIGKHLTIDETSLSQGELYTIVTNKAAHGKKGTIVAMIKGTDAQTVSNVLLKIPRRYRCRVQEITLDMAASMIKIVRTAFPQAVQVTDRFHVQQLVFDAVQELRIKFRWEAIDRENEQIAYAKQTNQTYIPEVLANGDTHKQLLARSRYLLFKSKSRWTESQKQRAGILFEHYPLLKIAYKLAQELSFIFQTTKHKNIAYTRLAKWYNKVELSGIDSFKTVMRTIQSHYRTILNFFDNRSTNAAAESFNAKIKALRSQFRGVRDVKFFLFRLSKIYA